MKKKALGKGLKAFIPEDYGILKEEKYAELDIDLLRPNPLQPRMDFDEDSLLDLSNSIKKSGLLQPLIVVPEGDSYRIVVGERRWRAAQRAGLKKIPVIIRSMDAIKQLETSLIENIQRKDLNPLEIALAYQRLIEELGYTQEELAGKVGKDRSSVANYLRLLKLPKEIQNYLAENKISMGHARALLSLEDEKKQTALAQETIRRNMSVREVERAIQRLKSEQRTREKTISDPDLIALQEEILKHLGTKVSISGTQNKGVIKIYYFSLDDLNRIYEIIKGVRR